MSELKELEERAIELEKRINKDVSFKVRLRQQASVIMKERAFIFDSNASDEIKEQALVINDMKAQNLNEFSRGLRRYK